MIGSFLLHTCMAITLDSHKSIHMGFHIYSSTIWYTILNHKCLVFWDPILWHNLIFCSSNLIVSYTDHHISTNSISDYLLSYNTLICIPLSLSKSNKCSNNISQSKYNHYYLLDLQIGFMILSLNTLILCSHLNTNYDHSNKSISYQIY